MHTIYLTGDKESNTCVINSDEDGLTALAEMIKMKLKMKQNSSETLICKNLHGSKFKLRFDLIDT
jgi:hypothetical protein